LTNQNPVFSGQQTEQQTVSGIPSQQL